MSDTRHKDYLVKQASQELAASLKPEPITSPMSLFKIEAEMQELGELLEQSIEDGNEAESAAIAVQIQRYLGAEVAKVDSYHGFIRNAQGLVAQIKAEEERLRRSRTAWEGVIERVKAGAVYAMGLIGKKRLEGSRGRRLRLQANPVSVEVTDATAVPDEFLRVTAEMSVHTWQEINRQILFKGALNQKGTAEVSLSRIKAFIEAGMVCPECKGSADCTGTADDGIKCPRCEGSGKVPGHVPGARLVKDRQHLRVE